MQSQTRRQRPLQSVPSPLPQMSPGEASPALVSPQRCWPKRSQAHPLGMLHPAPTLMPLHLQRRSDPHAEQQGQRQLQAGCLSNRQLPAMPTPRSAAASGWAPATALPPPRRYLGLRQGKGTRGRLSPRHRSCQLRLQKLPDSAGHAPRWQRWSRTVGGSGQRARRPASCLRPRPCPHHPAAPSAPFDGQLPPGHVPQFPPGRAALAAHGVSP